MIHRRRLQVYFRIISLIVLIAIFYLADFWVFLQTTIFSGWFVLSSVLLFLVFVFFLQRRKVIWTAVLASEEDNRQGALLILLALALYIGGSYTILALWLHSCSIVLFIAGCLNLMISSRISRMMFLPFVALLFVVPVFQKEVFEVQNLPLLVVLYLGVEAVIVVLVACIVGASKRRRLKNDGFMDQASIQNSKSVHCQICGFGTFQNEDFCSYCGRRRSPFRLKPFKAAFLKFLFLLLIVLVLSYAYVPAFSLKEGEALLVSYTPHGMEDQTIIPTPEGWKLESYERLSDYEKEQLQDFVALATYTRGSPEQNKSYIQFEIGPGSPYLRNRWNLPGWNRTRQDTPLAPGITGRQIKLLRGNESMYVLYWTLRSAFKVGSAFSTRNVGVSIFSNFSRPIAESQASEVADEFRRASISIISWWGSISGWTSQLNTWSETFAWFKDIVLAIAGVGLITGIAGWIRERDEKVNTRVQNALMLIRQEPIICVAISRMKQRRFSGKELFDAYKQASRFAVEENEFHEKLNRCSAFGLIKKDYIISDGQLVMVWKKILL